MVRYNNICRTTVYFVHNNNTFKINGQTVEVIDGDTLVSIDIDNINIIFSKYNINENNIYLIKCTLSELDRPNEPLSKYIKLDKEADISTVTHSLNSSSTFVSNSLFKKISESINPLVNAFNIFTENLTKNKINIKIDEDKPELVIKNNMAKTDRIITLDELYKASIFKNELIDDILRKLDRNFCIALSGTSGLGKSYLVSQLLEYHNAVYYRIKATESLDNTKLTYEKTIDGTKVITIEGIVAEAIRRKDENNGKNKYFICIEELNHCKFHTIAGGLWEWCNPKSSKIDVLGDGRLLERPDNLKLICTENPLELVTDAESFARNRRIVKIPIRITDIDIDKLIRLTGCPNIVNRWIEINTLIIAGKSIAKDRLEYNDLADLQFGPCNIFSSLIYKEDGTIDEQESYKEFKDVAINYFELIGNQLIKYNVNVNDIFKLLDKELTDED